MTTYNLDSSNNGETENYTATTLAPVIVNVATTTGDAAPTVTIDATLLTGSFTVNATEGATANVVEEAGALGTLSLLANGGTIDATAGLNVGASTSITIEGGGTFIAGSSFLGALDDASVAFAADSSATDTLVIDNKGGLLDVSLTSPVQGFVSNHEVINDKLISAAAVSSYSIAQSGAGQPQTVTYYSGGTTLGSLEFSAGTFTALQLGTYSEGSGPLQLTANAFDGSLTMTRQAACYLAGTHILTEQGEVAVESLRIGDLIVTASGDSRPVVWLGHRRLDVSRHPTPRSVWPVKVVAGAFGDNLPRRDLWLSPGHNIANEGALMPISILINDLTIMQVERDEVEYWHVELDAHDVLLAEGLPAESYLDCGNRTDFSNGGAFVEAHPDFRPNHWAETCLPLMQEGPPVARTKMQLIGRLEELGHRLVQDADAHIIVDGLRVEPFRLAPQRLAFSLPAGNRKVTLHSNVFVPSRVWLENGDTRGLGLCIRRLRMDGLDVELANDAQCASGWHQYEATDDGQRHRWTTGATPLPAGGRTVVVDLACLGCYWNKSNLGKSRLAALS